MDSDVTRDHGEWLRRIEAEVEGELSLAERAALARHLLGCQHCAGARASHLELRAAMAASAGDPHARTLARPAIGTRRVVLYVVLALAVGGALGWLVHLRYGAPGQGALEAGRATIVAP